MRSFLRLAVLVSAGAALHAQTPPNESADDTARVRSAITHAQQNAGLVSHLKWVLAGASYCRNENWKPGKYYVMKEGDHQECQYYAAYLEGTLKAIIESMESKSNFICVPSGNGHSGFQCATY